MMNLKLQDMETLEGFKKADTSSWETLQQSIYVRIMNEKYLEYYNPDIAHSKFMDLVYTVAVQEHDRECFRSHMLTNQELKEYDVSFDDILVQAMNNSSHDRNKRLMRMRDSLMMRENPISPLCVSIPKDMPLMVGKGQPGIIRDIDEDDNENVLVVRNSKGPLGSAYGFLQSTLDEVYERFNKTNFYILPMSVDEVMFVSEKYATHNHSIPQEYVEDDLLDMIECNNDAKDSDWKNVLSYRIYYYLGDDGKRVFPIKR